MPVAIDLILELFEELFAACFQILTAIWVYLLGSQSANRKYLKFSPKEIKVTEVCSSVALRINYMAICKA